MVGRLAHMVVHGGVEHFLVDLDDRIVVTNLSDPGRGYRVPAWWPSGDRYVLVSEDRDGRRGLYVTEANSQGRTFLEEVRGGVAFLWSPDGQSLAVARSPSGGGLVYQTVGLFLPDGMRRRTEIRDRVVAFYWSPDSAKLAYMNLTDTRGVFRWKVLDVTNGRRQTLVDFTPSGPQLTLFQFFDQFAYSHTPWSPNSDALVFAGQLSGWAVSVSHGRQPRSQIIVVGLVRIPSTITDGLMAFWSPR